MNLHLTVIKLFSCVPDSTFCFSSDCSKAYAPTWGSIFNTIGFEPKCYVLVASTQHLTPLFLPGASEVSQAGGQVPPRLGGGADAVGSLVPEAGWSGLPPAQCALLATKPSTEIRDLVKAVTLPHHKLACTVSIQSNGRMTVVLSRSLWEP